VVVYTNAACSVVIPLPVQVILSKCDADDARDIEAVVIPLPVQVILSNRGNRGTGEGYRIVVIPLPVQVILSIDRIDSSDRNLESRNPFTGSGHSFAGTLQHKFFSGKKGRNPFTGSGHSFFNPSAIGFIKKIEVVIPLPVQVILSLAD